MGQALKKKITRQNMINCKHALGKIVPFRIGKFGGFFVCCFYEVKVAFLMTCNYWLNKAEESNGVIVDKFPSSIFVNTGFQARHNESQCHRSCVLLTGKLVKMSYSSVEKSE